MHLARPNFCTKGSGVWGDKSQVLFVNDKAIISLVLHRGKKKNLTAKIQRRIPRETTELIGCKSFLLFFSSSSQEQTNGPLRATDRLRRSYRQTRWQPAPAEVLGNLGRDTGEERKEGQKKDRHKMRGEEKEKMRKEQGWGESEEARQRTEGGDEIKERTDCATGGTSHVSRGGRGPWTWMGKH